MTSIKKIFPFLACACSIVLSCNSNDASVRYENIQKDSLVIHLQPADKSSYYYTTVNHSEIFQEVKDQKIEIANTIQSGLLYEFSKDSSGNIHCKTTYKDFKLKAKFSEEEREIDAATAANSLFKSDRVFAAFKDASFTAELTPEGQVKTISGLSELKERMYALANNNEEILNMLNGSFQQYVTEDFFRSTIEQSFGAFPDKAIKPGDSWTKTDKLSLDVSLAVTTIYTLKKVRDNRAIIALSAGINTENQVVSIGGNSTTTSMKGNQEGEIEVDIATGMLLKAEISIDIKGNAMVAGIDVPFTMKTRINSEGKKL